MTWVGRFKQLTRRPADSSGDTEPAFDPTSWSGALIVMCALAAVLWIVQIVNAIHGQSFGRFGIEPRRIGGLWGILTQPFLHVSYAATLSDTVPLVLIGWVVLLSGVRTWVIVTAVVIVLGGAATWLVAPSGPDPIVGASGLVFGWLGYLLARAYFSRRIWWIVVAVLVLFFFGTLLNGLLPGFSAHVSWQSHVCGFAVGVLAAAILHRRHPRGGRERTRGQGVS